MPHQTFSQPVSLFCAAAPADTVLLTRWETQLLPLQQARILTFWSEQHLSVGAVREEELLTHLKQADAIILLLSSDFFASEECLVLMERALQRQKDEGTRIVPLLLRASEWQTTPLGHLAFLPGDGIPVTEWDHQDKAFDACLRKLRSLLQLPPRPTHTPIPGKKSSDKNQERMLRRLRRSYKDLMDQSLQDIAWMDLGLIQKPQAVQNVANLALRVAQQAEQPLSPGVSIIEVYEEAEQELLILGEPGSGKSTELLYLARHLVALAEQEETEFLPVILPLSSWAVKQGALADWMVEQIAVDYDIPRKMSQQWVNDEQILPLLDGLDEMEEAARPACIAAINAYHRAHPTPPLVVCSRTTEYESAADKQRLALQNAVVVRPLTSEQVKETLNRTGQDVAGLQGALQRQPMLQDLATTPLMLNVLMLAYQGTTVRTNVLNEADLEQKIWTDYVERMVKRKEKDYISGYSLSRIRTCLGWLAQRMRLRNQTQFYIERMQPDWLEDQQSSRWYEQLAVMLPGILIGILVSFVVCSIFSGIFFDNISLIMYALTGGLEGIPLIVGTTRDECLFYPFADPIWREADDETLIRRGQQQVGAVWPHVASFYLGDQADGQPLLKRLLSLLTFDQFTFPAIQLAEAQVHQGAPVWIYRFDWHSPLFGGAAHSLDRIFVWNLAENPTTQQMTGNAPERVQLDQQMQRAWTAFAYHGDPAIPDLPAWPGYDLEQRATMLFDRECTIQNDPYAEARQIWAKALISV